MSGILPSIIYPSTVSDEQARLAAALTGTNASVTACAQLDPSTRTSWGLFYATALGFTKESPGIFGLGTMMDRAQNYEAELLAWQKTLAKTCPLGIPQFDTNPPFNTDALQYIAWGLGAVAGAYLVGQVLSFVPRPPQK